MIQKYSVYIPNKRALTNYENSSLPLGIKYSEFRWLLYLSFDKAPYENLQVRKVWTIFFIHNTCKKLQLINNN